MNLFARKVLQAFSFGQLLFHSASINHVTTTGEQLLWNYSGRAQCTYRAGIFNVAPLGTSSQGSWEPRIEFEFKNTPMFARNCVSHINPVIKLPNQTSAILGELARKAQTFASIPLYMQHLPKHNPSLCCYKCNVGVESGE